MSIIIALAGDPELLLLDEPMSGLNAEEIQTLLRLIGSIRGKGAPALSWWNII